METGPTHLKEERIAHELEPNVTFTNERRATPGDIDGIPVTDENDHKLYGINLVEYAALLVADGYSESDALEKTKIIAHLIMSIIRLEVGLDPVALTLDEQAVDKLTSLKVDFDDPALSMVKSSYDQATKGPHNA